MNKKRVTIIMCLIAVLYISIATAQTNKLYLAKKDYKYGYVDAKGEEVINYLYDEAKNFNEGLAAVKKKGKWGYIDSVGVYVIAPQFKNAGGFNNGLAPVKLDDKWGFINKQGQFEISPQFDNAGMFGEGLAPVKQNKNWGYIDKEGNVIIPYQFGEAYTFNDGVAVAGEYDHLGYIDKSGRFVTSNSYCYASYFRDNIARVGVSKGISYNYKFIDKSGQFITTEDYDDAFDFKEGMAAVKRKKWGFINKKGEVAIPMQYDKVLSFSEGVAGVRLDKKSGYIDKNGHEIFPLQFDEVYSFYDGLGKVKVNGETKFVDKEGNLYATRKEGESARTATLSTYLSYYLGERGEYLRKQGITRFTKDSLINYVEKEINSWQEKSEFETESQWRERVNKQTRESKAKDIAQKYYAEYESTLKTANLEYDSLYDSLVHKYSKIMSDRFDRQIMTLHPYDAENHSFLISTESFVDIKLSVPISEAQEFKNNWDSFRQQEESEFVQEGNDMVLSKVKFGKYVYDSNIKEVYTPNSDYADIEKLDFSELNFAFLNLQNDIPDKSEKRSSVSESKGHQTSTRQSDVDVDIPRSKKSSKNTFALVIANSNYDHASKVENAHNDGKIMTEYLTKTLGIPESNLMTCYDATYGKIVNSISFLKDISKAYGKDNFNVVFYYVGHGFPDETEFNSYLLPVDANPQNTSACISIKDLYHQLGGLGARSVTVMLDACFSGSNHGEGMLLNKSMGVARKVHPDDPVGNMVILSASQGDQTAYPYDEKKHSMFTYYVLKKLKETKGDVTIGDLADFVIDKVQKTSLEVNRKIQSPSVMVSRAMTNWQERQFVPNN